MKAVLLCAGYGTRLKPLTDSTPKALLNVGGKPILNHILHKLSQVSTITEVSVISNEKFFYHFLEWASTQSKHPSVKVYNDGTKTNDTRLGALGDLHFYFEQVKPDDDLLIIAGDNLFELSLTDMDIVFQNNQKTLIAAYDVKDKELAKQYGIVAVDDDYKLTHFVEKPQVPQSTLASTGIYMIPKNDVHLLKEYLDRGHSKDKLGSFFEWLHKKEDVYCYVTDRRWYDIGTKEQLQEADDHYSEH